MLIRVQIARFEIQESRGRNGNNRPASWFHLEVQRFACDGEYVEDVEQCAQYWRRYRDCESHAQTERLSARP
jgi:hypothetical protein